MILFFPNLLDIRIKKYIYTKQQNLKIKKKKL